MNPELTVYFVVFAILGVLFMGRTRDFIAAYACVLVFQSLITYSSETVIANIRLFPQDVAICMMLLLYPFRLLIKPNAHGGKELIQIFIIIAAILFFPAIRGYLGGASLRNVLRDCRPIVYLMSLIPLISVMRNEKDWQWFLTVFRKAVVVCAYLMLLGILTGWRLQENAPDNWQTTYSVSGEFERGYGVISSYIYFPIVLYLDIRQLIWSKGKQRPSLRMLNTVVLAVAMLATFVRATVLAFFVMMFVLTILIFYKLRRYRTKVWKFWTLSAMVVVLLLSISIMSPYTQAMLERAGSIIVPGLGGEKGQGTVTARLRVIPFTLESFEDPEDMILGHGYGTEGLEPWQLSTLNHNSYFWLIYHGGFLMFSIVIMGFLYLALRIYRNENYSFTSRIDAVGVIAAAFSFGTSTGLLFNQKGPLFIPLIALFLAGCNASQYGHKGDDICLNGQYSYI